jgi:hypothetical protein
VPLPGAETVSGCPENVLDVDLVGEARVVLDRHFAGRT